MLLKSLKQKRVWQAQFLSYVLLIFKKFIFFEDVQMIAQSVLDISMVQKFQKIQKLVRPYWSSPWII